MQVFFLFFMVVKRKKKLGKVAWEGNETWGWKRGSCKVVEESREQSAGCSWMSYLQLSDKISSVPVLCNRELEHFCSSSHS